MKLTEYVFSLGAGKKPDGLRHAYGERFYQEFDKAFGLEPLPEPGGRNENL